MRITACSLLLLLSLLALPAVAPADTTESAARDRPSIGLALGSGGASGLAHIAMLQVFDDLDMQPDRIAGSSTGAVIGALYAAGLSAGEIYDIFADFSGSNMGALWGLMTPGADLTIGDLLQFDFSNGGLLDADGFITFLGTHMEAREFSDLEIPLEIVATDYWTGATVVLEEGNLLEAIEASMAVPGLFSPVTRDGQLLVDGGTSNPLPFHLLRSRHDRVIAIDVSGTRQPVSNDEVEWLDMLFNTFELMQQSIIAAQMRMGEPDLYIKPDIRGIRLLHFNRINEVLEQAAPAAERLRAALSNHGAALNSETPADAGGSPRP